MKKVALTDIGLKRETNQDSFFLSNKPGLPLFIITDGMGGYKGGEIASDDAVKAIKDFFISNQENLKDRKKIIKTIEDSIKNANDNIYKKSLESLEYSGMGTTVSLCYIHESSIYIGHVGDSRMYIIKDNKIFQITEDHSLVNELIKKGEITKDEARNHPQKNLITRAVGSSSDIDIDIEEIYIAGGEKILLCTDGLYNMFSDEELLKIINQELSLQDIGDELVNGAKENGGYDNISLVLLEI